MSNLVKSDSETILSLRNLLYEIMNEKKQVPLKDKIINICRGLIVTHGSSKVTKTLLENSCVENNTYQPFLESYRGWYAEPGFQYCGRFRRFRSAG